VLPAHEKALDAGLLRPAHLLSHDAASSLEYRPSFGRSVLARLQSPDRTRCGNARGPVATRPVSRWSRRSRRPARPRPHRGGACFRCAQHADQHTREHQGVQDPPH
jgi:hypothetical protein